MNKIKTFYLGASSSNPVVLFDEMDEIVNKFLIENNIKDFEVKTNLVGYHSRDYGDITEYVITIKYKE